MSGEVYSLQVDGEQRGPYTLRQIDHLLNSGLIKVDSLFWRDGMEHWQPVTDLVALRPKPKRWKLRGAYVAAAVAVLLVARFFGPVVVEGWRESAQYDFTERAAYWRAREAVRRHLLEPGTVVKFGGFATARSILEKTPAGAHVELTGETLGGDGVSHPHHWEIEMTYDVVSRQWVARTVREKSG